jgi:hypothetical protein
MLTMLFLQAVVWFGGVVLVFMDRLQIGTVKAALSIAPGVVGGAVYPLYRSERDHLKRIEEDRNSVYKLTPLGPRVTAQKKLCGMWTEERKGPALTEGSSGRDVRRAHLGPHRFSASLHSMHCSEVMKTGL